jgi:hypothetical protein
MTMIPTHQGLIFKLEYYGIDFVLWQTFQSWRFTY